MNASHAQAATNSGASPRQSGSGLPPVVDAVRKERVGSGATLRVTFFEFQHKPSLVETAFELAHRHLEAGDQVTYRFLGHDLPYTYMSPLPGSVLVGPWLPERTAAKLVSQPHFTFVQRTKLPRRPLPFAVPDALQDLMRVRHEGFDVGMAVASSMISQTRDSHFRPAEQRAHVERVLQGALATYEHALQVLEEEQPDLVYLFNGRFAYERAVWRACQACGVPCLLYEWASGPERFFLRQFSTHDRVRVQEEMRAAWRDAPDREQARTLAERWFSERREGQPRDWPSFTTLQKRSLLPTHLDSAPLIAYFSSSDDEYVAIGDEYRWRGWASQLDAMRDLIRLVERLGDTRLVLRVHPQLVYKHPGERTRWMAFEGTSPSLTVIPPESDVDTYALVEAARVVVTAGSTVGVEAVYWGRPSILLGPSEYDELDIAHRPFGSDDLERMLRDPALDADRDAALVYGHYRATFGEPFTVYRPTGFHRGTFLGADLRPKPWRVLAASRQYALGKLALLRQRRAAMSNRTEHQE